MRSQVKPWLSDLRSDNESGGNSNTDTLFGYGTQMGLAVFNGQIYPIWAGNLNQGHIVNGAVQGPYLSIFYQPMVIADGPRIINSTDGCQSRSRRRPADRSASP